MITPPKLQIGNGPLEAMKWLALLAMTGDHINKFLLNSTYPWLYDTGRLALPLFVLVLAYNLARPNVIDTDAYYRTAARLLISGVVAMIPYASMSTPYGGLWPLNVMFTLLAMTTVIFLIDQRLHAMAFFAFIVGGAVGEFWWPALGFGIAVWCYVRNPSWLAAAFAVVSIAMLTPINGNAWAMATLPLFCLASRCEFSFPRKRWFFYAYYPLHLSALAIIRIPMGNAGFLFFT